MGTIAAELGVHHDTVRGAIEAERFIRPNAVHRTSMLDPYKAFLAETLERHPRLRATRLFEMVRDRGYGGSVVQLRRNVATIRPTPREAYLRLETLPGEQAQVDWGHFGTIKPNPGLGGVGWRRRGSRNWFSQAPRSTGGTSDSVE